MNIAGIPTKGPATVPPPESGNDIDRWFEQRASKHKRLTALYPSLLTGRIFAYFRYRLRYPLLLSSVQFAVHVAEFFVILSSLGGVAAFTVMMLRVGSLIVSGAWWGLLEVMRERLRVFSRSGQREASEREVGRWIVLAAVLGLTLMVAATVTVVLLKPSGDDPVANWYSYLIIAELAVTLPVRVLHSGVYATRRVYRPLWAMFVSPAVQLAVLSIGFYYYPAAAIVISIIAANALGTWITIHYSLEAYRLIGLRPRFPTLTCAFWRMLPAIPPWVGLKTTLSGLSLRLDGVLVLAIVGIYGTNTRSFDLTAADSAWRQVDAFQFFYLVLPLFRGSYEIAGVFYFDFVRLRSFSAFHEFRRLFFHKLLYTAPFIALYFWSLAALLGLVVLPDVPLTFLLALMPLFVVRSVIGIYQVRLFADGRSGTHLATVAFLAVLLWLVWIKPNPASDLIEITAAMITQLILLMNVQHFRDRRNPPLPPLLMLGDWLRTLALEPGPVLAGKLAMPDTTTPQQRSAARQLMRQAFNGKGYFSYRSPAEFLYFERTSNGQSSQPHLTLQAATGGIVNRGTCLPAPATNGRNALDALTSRQWLQPIDDASSIADGPDALKGLFRSLFPDGVAFDLETLDGAKEMRTLDQSVLARALPAAIACIEEGASYLSLEDRWLTPVCQRGTLRLLFILPPDSDASVRKRWREAVKAWHAGWATTETAGRSRDD